MTFMIQKIEDFSASIGGYYATVSVFVALLGILICFFSHRVREAMGYVVATMTGAMLGLVVASVILVASTNDILRSLITLAVALLILYAAVKSPVIPTVAMAFTPIALAVGVPLAKATGSTGVGVFVGLVFGALAAVLAMKFGRYVIICINALAASFFAVLAGLSCFGVLSKVYEQNSLYIFAPVLLLAVLGASYQISVNPERLAEKAAKVAAEEERRRAETSGATWSCSHCYTTNKKANVYCRSCGRTEFEQTKPDEIHLVDSANPGWRCSCGRINNLSKHKCECGNSMANVSEWACSCGIRNGHTTEICTGCGQLRYQPYAKNYTPVEVPKLSHAHHGHHA